MTATHCKDALIGSREVYRDLAAQCLHPDDIPRSGPTHEVEEMDPLLGLRDAVLREWRAPDARHGGRARGADRHARLAGGAEDRRGQLKPGMLADLVILDRDAFDDLQNAAVVDTSLNGRSTVDP